MKLTEALTERTGLFEEQYGPLIFHILPAKDWEKAVVMGIYTPSSVVLEGFIHCSKTDQVEHSLHAYFSDRKELLLLCLAETKVQAEIRYEDLYNVGQKFPHIYGPLNLDAVVGVLDVNENRDGELAWN